MDVKKVPINQAVGHILLHNQAGAGGQKVLKKGRLLTEADIKTLQSLGKSSVYVAILADDDIGENEAAACLSKWLTPAYVTTSSATTGRVNLIASQSGVLKINVEALQELNEISGITLATLPANRVVQPKKIVGTIKIIPYGVSKQNLDLAHNIIEKHPPLLTLNPFSMKRAALILTGSEAARQRIIESFTPALNERLAAYGTTLLEGPYVAEDEQAISQAITEALERGVEMVLIAGETSIMDRDDITPRAIKAVGAEIVHYGVPVEPGNLLLLAYQGQIPIVGAPGCAKSKHYNVVDMVLPRLASGERLTQRDLIALGHGGYLL